MKHVDTRHADYSKFSPKWKRARDTMAGQDAVHAAGTDYLPKLQAQEDDQYRAYLKRAGFYNATWRTVSGLLGMMFSKPPAVELPGVVGRYTNDIDMAGMTLETFARKTALEILGPGRVGILVDHPSAEIGAVSLAAAEMQGLRPMLKHYRAETIINWEYSRIRNYWVLSKVVLEETLLEPDGEFKSEEVKQWRVLDLDERGHYRQRVFRKPKKGGVEFEQVDGDIYPMMGNKPLDFVPFYILGVDGLDSELDEPPLIDLIDLNLAHYRSNADYEHGCHFTGLPTLFLSGFVDSEGNTPSFYIGSQAAIVAQHAEAQGKYIEFTGKGLEHLETNLAKKEERMAAIGARMLAPEKRQVESAETASIHRSGENSVLAAIATAISEGLEKALTVFAQWAGASGKVEYQLNRDFNPAMLDAPKITALMKAVQSGLMSEQTWWELMQRADIADSEVSWEAEQERIGQQEPPAPPAVNDDIGEAA